MGKLSPLAARGRRHLRVRKKVTGTPLRPRLCVFRSLNHIYAQIVDDSKGHVLASASSLEPELRQGKRKEKSIAVGRLIAQRALAKGINRIVFDRGGYKYHGRVKALAETAREGGLGF